MSVTPPFEPIAGVFERNLSIRHVYGEPLHHGDTTVIPVAKVAYGFGAGGGRRPAARSVPGASSSAELAGPEAQGGGGGGGARLTPIGALEVGPRGTRFVHYNQLPRLAGAFVLGVGVGALLTSRFR
jgi:uncharacterized spore protein YtfJ